MRGLVPTELPRPEAEHPLVRLDIPQKALSQIKTLKPGDPVRVVLIGKCEEVSQREPDVDFGGNVGELRVEVHKMEVRKADDQFGELFDDD